MVKYLIAVIAAAVYICTPVISMGDMEFKWLQYRQYYPNMLISHFAYIYSECSAQKVPIEDVCAIIANESQYNDRIISKSGDDAGLMQVNRVHWVGSAEDMLKLSTNVRIGISKYRSALVKAKGDKKTAFRFYNAGENSNPQKYKNWRYVSNICRDIWMSRKLVKDLCYLEVVN